MNIVEINSVYYGSTGNIAIQIADLVNQQNDSAYVCTSGGRNSKKQAKNTSKQLLIGGFVSEKIHLVLGRITGYNNCFSYFATKAFLSKLKKLNPDVIHLHNLHNCYINLPLLFKFIKKNNIRVVWTLHDCWAFTGHCPYFEFADCYKWKTTCAQCSQYKKYPISVFDNSKKMYRLKQKWFLGIKDLTIVTPSKWLADYVKQSFLKKYPVKVINNGIDLSVFQPTQSDFREKYNCQNKTILLGVASSWEKRKGLEDFIKLREKLDDNFQIVLVGTSKKIDEFLPKNIISIHRTYNQEELAKIYSAADLFINPTLEDNFPTVNIEALACGTPVITYNTGGSAEMLDNASGTTVEKGNFSELYDSIMLYSKSNSFSSVACVKRAQDFDKNKKFKEYIDLFKEKTGELIL